MPPARTISIGRLTSPAVEAMKPAGARSARKKRPVLVRIPNHRRCASPSPIETAVTGSAVVWLMPSGAKTSSCIAAGYDSPLTASITAPRTT